MSNGNPLWFFEKCFKNLIKNAYIIILHVVIMFITLNIPYFGHDSRRFINKVQNIINSKLQLTLKINPVYKTFKVSQYF